MPELALAQSSGTDSAHHRPPHVRILSDESEVTGFEAVARDAYRRSNLPEPKAVIFVPSPIVLCLAGSIAALAVERMRWLTLDTPTAYQRLIANWSSSESAHASAVRSAVDSVVRSSVGSMVELAVYSAVLSTLRPAVDPAVRPTVEPAVRSAVDLAVDSAVCSANESAVRPTAVRSATAWFDEHPPVSPRGCWIWQHRDFVLVSDLPVRQLLDSEGRLHSEDGPAVLFRDGWGLWRWHGSEATEQIIERPETLTAEQISSERNVEVRRVMLERFGTERYLREGGSELLHEDEFGKLWRTNDRFWPGRNGWDDEPLVMVEVVNSTPEPDGTYRDYFLRVPPSTRTAREAVAWTFDVTEDQYALAAQS